METASAREDFVSWRIPRSMIPNGSLDSHGVAGSDRAALWRIPTLRRFRASAAPLAWDRTSGTRAPPLESTDGHGVRHGDRISAPREGSAAPFSDETALFDTATFSLWLPQIAVDAGEMGMLAEELAEIEPVHSDAFGPETKIGETLLPRGSNWLPIGADSVLPASSPELGGALAQPKLGADLVAKASPSQLRNGARSLNAGVPISMPNRAVRLKEGPEFFAAEPVVANSVARPLTANAYAAVGPLAMPLIPASTSDTLLKTAANTPALLPISGSTHQVVLSDAAKRHRDRQH
jgi:hypothetical protein